MDCISCGRPYHESMLKLVGVAGKVRIHQAGETAGHVFCLCRSSECLVDAKNKHLLEQAFPDKKIKSLYTDLAKVISKKDRNISKLIGLGVRSMHIRTGTSAVREIIQKGHAKLVLLNTIQQGDTYRRIRQLSVQANIPVIDYADDSAFDQIVGKVNCQCAAVTDSELAHEILRNNEPE